MRNPRTPLASVIDSYLLHCQDKKPRTREFYAYQLATFAKWLRANGFSVAKKKRVLRWCDIRKKLKKSAIR